MKTSPAHQSLYQLNQQIKQQLSEAFGQPQWVIAEISEINTNRSGHCYLELIEKSADNDQIIAKARATIWSFTYRMLKPYFETTTGQVLTRGLKVLVKATVEFHEVFGLSLNISDIDPSYTMGDMARRRREIILRLEEEGIARMNKEIELALVPQRIAIISSPSAAGYEDFIKQLEHNPRGYKIYHHLFPALMQGKDAEQSIIHALERIFEHDNFFDAVAIIRGGGSTADLLCFDGYELAANVAQFPIPVLTGIGHERDESVVDLVSHTRLKTPTAVAEFIINTIDGFFNNLMLMQDSIVSGTQRYIDQNRHQLDTLPHRLKSTIQNHLNKQSQYLTTAFHRAQNGTQQILANHQHQLSHLSEMSKYKSAKYINKRHQHLDYLKSTLSLELKAYFREQKQKIALLEKTSLLLNPFEILKKGYTITALNGQKLKSGTLLKPGDLITTHFSDGDIKSRVE